MITEILLALFSLFFQHPLFTVFHGSIYRTEVEYITSIGRGAATFSAEVGDIFIIGQYFHVIGATPAISGATILNRYDSPSVSDYGTHTEETLFVIEATSTSVSFECGFGATVVKIS